MIKKLRRKFVIILMSIITLILLAIFALMFLFSWNNSKRISEDMLHQALISPAFPYEASLPPNKIGQMPDNRKLFRARMPFMNIEVSSNNKIIMLTNQLYFIDNETAISIARTVLKTPKQSGTEQEYGLRWLKSNDETRIAFVDISMEQEVLKNLVINSLILGTVALTVFFFISQALARWAVKPVELAWEKQKQFVADASHELKTPLTVILSNADMLNKEELLNDNKNLRRIEHIKAETVRMRRLVEDLLTLAKYDNTENKELKEKIDFSFVIKSAILTFESIIFDEKKQLSYEIPDDIHVIGNIYRLQQLINILLDNAVKYSPVGGMINISLKKTEKNTALLTIQSDGEPIAKDELQKIFQRFYCIDKARSTHDSFGLGLSIAENIVKNHKGKIWAESDSKLGNSFYILLPQKKD